MTLSLGVLLLLLVLGIPIGMAFGLAGFQYGQSQGIPAESLASIPYEAVSSFPLLAIPLFLVMGELMREGDLARQLFVAVHWSVRRLQYSVGYVVIGTCAFLGAITGSSVATVTAVGGLIKQPMLDRGYPIGYVGALTASAGLLGVLIPPSIPLIIYGSTASVSVSNLFLASMAPGLIFVLVFALTHRWLAPRVLGAADGKGKGGERALDLQERFELKAALPALLMPLLVLGGIYGGLFTPTEAAAAGCVYAIGVCLARHGLDWAVYRRAFSAGALSSGIVLAILAYASIFNRALTLQQVPNAIAGMALSVTSDPTVFLLAVTAVMFLIGMLMETNTAVLLMAPLLAPVSERYGIDPLQFGVLLVTTIEIGLLTPPMAANVFVAAKVTGAPIPALFRQVWPFVATSMIVLGLVILVPALTTWPSLLN
jgi:tripartite ATP-independent transporter DctM subunit